MSETLEQRLNSLESAVRLWKRVCAAALLFGSAGVLAAQVAGPVVHPVLLCRGIKVLDPQGRKRGEFVMAGGAVGLRMFDEDGRTVAHMGTDRLTFLDTEGIARASLSRASGLRVGDPQGALSLLNQDGLAVLDSAHEVRALISLGQTPRQFPALEPEGPSLQLFGADGRGYEVFAHGSSHFQ